MWNEPVPLFPLNTVLFPRMPLPLRIFEDRYKTMVNRCIEHGKPFGVVLIREGAEVGPPAVPERIGTLAQIRVVERLAEGRMHLMTEGTERFRLLDTMQGAEPYLVGIAEPLVDTPCGGETLGPLEANVRRLFGEYFSLLLACAGQPAPEYELPETAHDLSFVIAAVLQVDAVRRQTLLELTDTAERLRDEQTMLERQVGQLRDTLTSLRESPPTPRTASDLRPDGLRFGSRN